jgi:hypothetical protein
MLNLTEQRILVSLSEKARTEKSKHTNIFNRELAVLTSRTEVCVSNSLQKLESDHYITINGRRGKGRLITILKPQYEIK